MERAIIRSDLTKKEIQPEPLLEQYLEQLRRDIEKIFLVESLVNAACPVTDEEAVQESFNKMGMQYNLSKSLGNIYLSPRPSLEKLKQFYYDSPARKFWLTELWPKTREVRQKKIILPLLEWIQEFIFQYSAKKELYFAEFLPNNWGYYSTAKNLFLGSNYTLIEPLFDPLIARGDLADSSLKNGVAESFFDAVFLFEALDRSVAPLELLQKALKSLQSGGLCFITCLLSSGFEIQVLRQKSDIFVPPERMNILSFEGMNALIDKVEGFEVLEFSTPGVLDIPNVIKQIDQKENVNFFHYLFRQRDDKELISSFQNFLQWNRLGTFGRLVLRKK